MGAFAIDPAYLTDGFKIRFRAYVSGSAEDADVDNVQLVAASPQGAQLAGATEQAEYIVLDPPAQAARAVIPGSLSPAAADLALLAWFDADSSSDDQTDTLSIQAADELALMLIE